MKNTKKTTKKEKKMYTYLVAFTKDMLGHGRHFISCDKRKITKDLICEFEQTIRLQVKNQTCAIINIIKLDK